MVESASAYPTKKERIEVLEANVRALDELCRINTATIKSLTSLLTRMDSQLALLAQSADVEDISNIKESK